MQKVHVNLGERSYDICITTADVAGLGLFARERLPVGRALVVADRNVASHVGPVRDSLKAVGFRVSSVEVPPGEEQKSLDRAARLYDTLVEAGADRRTVVVAL